MTTPPAHEVVFLVFDGVKLLDLAGPAEVFAEANKFGAAYALSYVSPSGGPVMSSTGTPVPVTRTLDDVAGADTVVICGGDLLAEKPIDPAILAAVQQLNDRARRLVSICTGSFPLAAAGLLSGRRATTHWRQADLLARAHPTIDVVPDALFVEDGNIFTSAGVSAGIDLALALVERDHGAATARSVARNLVVFLQRPGGQSQFSAPLEVPPPNAPGLRAVLEQVAADPAADHSTAKLAATAGVSPRHLERLFAAELDTTPARYVERVRLDLARALLDSGHTVAQAAKASGFGSTETLRRTFVARLGVSPSGYRARFSSAASGSVG